MAASSAETTELFNCTPEEFYQIVSDYENYPEFLSEVKETEIIKEEDNKKLVEFRVSLIKDFSYRLWITEEKNQGISWVFDSGDIFKISNGHWKLEDEAGKTRATYWVEAKFNMFVPGPIAKALVSVNLPNMISAYHKRIKEVYGK